MDNQNQARAHVTTHAESRNTQPTQPKGTAAPIIEAIGFIDLLAERLAVELGNNNEHELATGVLTLGAPLTDRLRAQVARPEWVELDGLSAESNALIQLMLESLCAKLSDEESAVGIASMASRIQRNLTAHVTTLQRRAA